MTLLEDHECNEQAERPGHILHKKNNQKALHKYTCDASTESLKIGLVVQNLPSYVMRQLD